MSGPTAPKPIPGDDCEHKSAVPAFDCEAARGLDAYEVRERWPRFFGICPDCGCQLIAYASPEHFMAGDW